MTSRSLASLGAAAVVLIAAVGAAGAGAAPVTASRDVAQMAGSQHDAAEAVAHVEDAPATTASAVPPAEMKGSGMPVKGMASVMPPML